MSKTSHLDDDLPPPYTESQSASAPTASAASASNASLPPSLTSSLTSPLASHLHALPDHMRATQEAQSTQQASIDLDIITLLVPHVEDFLSDLGNMPRSPPVAELTLVPMAAVPREWQLSGATERRREGEVLRVVKVEGPENLSKKPEKDKKPSAPTSSSISTSGWITSVDDSPASPSRQFDSSGWGRWNDDDDDDGISATTRNSESWWWQDERMARRLAAYLQPKTHVHMERKKVQAIVEKAKEEKKSGWGWGRRKTAESSATPPVIVPVPAPIQKITGPNGSVLADLDDRVTMVVRADEVTFRRENQFGVWESLTGFGLVVVVRIRR